MTLFFDILFGESIKKINQKDFDKALKSISVISPEERAYLNEVFREDLKDGLTEKELKYRIEKLSYNYNDSLDSDEVQKVKNKLLGMFDK